MARTIIRYSLDSDASNATGNQIRTDLQAVGFEKIGTASFEVWDIDQDAALNALDELFQTLKNPPGGGKLDHLWIYFDEPDDSN